MSSDTFVRVRWVATESTALPTLARLTLEHYRAKNLPELYSAVPMLPKTLNHQVIHGTFVPHRDVKAYRQLVAYTLGPQRTSWKPRGVVAGVIVFESPMWITKKHTVRKADVDNRIKVAIDAVALATSTEDASVWEAHAFKLVSRRTRTHVWLFDLGDVIDGHACPPVA